MTFRNKTDFKNTGVGLIPTTWSVAKILDVAEKVGIGPFGSSIKVETFVSDGVPVISGQHLRGIRLEDGDYKFISTEHADRLRNANVFRGDVIFTHAGNIGQVAYIPYDSKYERYILSQRQFYLRCNLKELLPEFAAYWFKTPMGQHSLLSNQSSTGVPSITQPVTHLRNIEIPLPSLSEQKSMCDILSSLDEKIALNHRINITLEELTSSLFKKWFVEIGEKLPKGWRVVEFTDVVDVLSGGTPKTRESQYWGGDIPFFTPKDAGGSAFTFETQKYITQSGLDSCNSPLYETNTTFITARGTVGEIAMAGIPMAMNQSCYALKGKGAVGSYFIYEMTRRVVDELKRNTHGSVFSTITIPTFSQISLPFPGLDLIKKYEATVGPIFERIKANCQESTKLISVRNSLLSPLMRGRVRMPQSRQNNQPAIKTSKAPQPFREAALIADLVASFAASDPLTRYRYTKYSYFAKRHLGQDASKEYAQMPGGPYNPRARYNGPENILIKKQYVRQNSNGFMPGPKMNEMLRYAQRYGFASGVDFVRRELVGKTDNELELLSTTDYAMLNLGKKGNQTPGADDVISEIKSENIWAPKLTKQHFSREKIAEAIQWLRARQLKYGY